MKALFFGVTALQILFCSLTPWAGEAKAAAATNMPDAERDKEIEYRLKWNLKTLLDDYEHHGRRDPKWDGPAKAGLTNFAQSRASFGSAKAMEASAKIPAAIKAAVSNGCDDPMIRYLYARSVVSSETHTEKELAEAYRVAAEGLSQSQYAPVRKFYAALRAAETLNLKGTNTPPEVHRWRDNALQYLSQAIRDKAMPPAEVYEACQQLLQAVKRNKKQLGEYYHTFEPILFNTWPSNSLPYLIKGTFYVDYAWQGRGADYAFKVTDQAWELFAERLLEAETALTKAWELNPRDERIARQMITVELGQGKGRSRMERWFERAADLNPDYYDAFHAKLYYLEPKWHGSPEDMLQFGQQCVNSKRWGGRVPLILMDAHESLAKYLPKDQQAAYWKQPEVWQDIKAALEKFLALNPEEIGWRHNYALYAYRAEQWDDLNRQLPLLGEIKFEFFGGKVEYEKMVRLAKEHAKK